MENKGEETNAVLEEGYVLPLFLCDRRGEAKNVFLMHVSVSFHRFYLLNK
jgi:hypothetical protein